MIRPASDEALSALHRAAAASDQEVDRALADVGVLPPLDLDPIRRALTQPDTRLAAHRNRDGHSIIEISWRGGALFIQPDGDVDVAESTAA